MLAGTGRKIREPTVAAHIQVDDATDSNIDHAEKPLILLLELLLIEDLNGQNGVFVGFPVWTSVWARVDGRAWDNAHIKALIPVWVQGLLDDASGMGLFSVDRSNSERIREAYHNDQSRSRGREDAASVDVRKTSRL